jgi:putative transposase
MKRVFRIQGEGKVKDIGLRGLANHPEIDRLKAEVAAIQALIPVGLHAIQDLFKEEVTHLAGPRYQRTGGQPGLVRWSHQGGSVYLLDQKLPVSVPRVRNLPQNTEVPLTTYQQLREPHQEDLGLFRKILLGLSCRDYQTCADAVPAAFGLSPTSVSRRFIRVSARKLRAFLERRLDQEEIIVVLLDGKTFAEDAMVLALGITTTGEKRLLGFVQTGTENEKVCAAFLRELVERGLRYEQGLLCIIDGSKGLRKAVASVFGARAVVQRCQWHKRENVVAYLPKGQQALWRRKRQAAYERPSYAEAKAALLRCRQELRLLNESAVTSLDEGFEETLTLHRLGVFGALGTSLKTTNCLESLNALVGQRTDKVDHWRSSDQKHRWLAAALLDIEPRLRRIRGYGSLPLLRTALQTEIRGQEGRAEHRAA